MCEMVILFICLSSALSLSLSVLLSKYWLTIDHAMKYELKAEDTLKFVSNQLKQLFGCCYFFENVKVYVTATLVAKF